MNANLISRSRDQTNEGGQRERHEQTETKAFDASGVTHSLLQPMLLWPRKINHKDSCLCKKLMPKNNLGPW